MGSLAWEGAMGSSEIAMTAHLVMPQGHADDNFLQDATRQLHDVFDIEHATQQAVRVPFTKPCTALSRRGCDGSPSDGQESVAGCDTRTAERGHEHPGLAGS
ncbi:MAG: hypothetical protein ABJA77_02850 [Variovorax sp.]